MNNPKFVVAVDPFAVDQVDMRNAVSTMKATAKSLKASLNPVSVVSPDQVQWPSDFDGSWSEQFETAARRNLKKTLKSMIGDGVADILRQPVHSAGMSAATIAEYTAKAKADALVVFTHNRKSPRLRFFGSFATALLSKSRTPILFINASSKPVRTVKSILFATDFSKEDEVALEIAMDWAKASEAELILFHALTSISPELYASVGLVGGYSNYELYVRDEEAHSQKTGKIWVDRAEKRGLKAQFVLHHTNHTPQYAVLKGAERLNCDLIVTCAKATRMETILIGSVTRGILERSKKPVLVIPATAAGVQAVASRAIRELKDLRPQ